MISLFVFLVQGCILTSSPKSPLELAVGSSATLSILVLPNKASITWSIDNNIIQGAVTAKLVYTPACSDIGQHVIKVTESSKLGTYSHVWEVNVSGQNCSWGWNGKELVKTDISVNCAFPNIAVSNNGTAIAVWRQENDFRIWASHYTPGMGWSVAQKIVNVISDPPQIAMDSFGNAIVIVNALVVSTPPYSLCAVRYDNNTGWEAPVVINDGSGGSPLSNKIAMNNNGNAIVTFYQNSHIKAIHYTPDSGWGEQIIIDNINKYMPDNALDMNDNGEAIAAFSTYNPWYPWANTYDSIMGWGTAQMLEGSPQGSTFTCDVSINDNGDAFVIAFDYTGDNTVYAGRYLKGIGWENLQPIGYWGTVEGGCGSVIKMDNDGNVVAVWNSRSPENIWENTYINGAGWGTPHAISVRVDSSPEMASDAAGNAIAVWSRYEHVSPYVYHIWAWRYISGTGWSEPERLEQDSDLGATSPKISMNDKGEAFVVWRQKNGSVDNVYCNRYTYSIFP